MKAGISPDPRTALRLALLPHPWKKESLRYHHASSDLRGIVARKANLIKIVFWDGTSLSRSDDGKDGLHDG